MKKNCIDIILKGRNNKKILKEEIFMPKFFLNLINLTKKAKRLKIKYNKELNQDLILDFQTTFSHMPKINFLSCKSKINEDNNLNNSSENCSKKVKYISFINNPERLIVKPSLPKINDRSHSNSFDNKNNFFGKNIDKNIITIEKNKSFKIFPIKIKRNISCNSNKSKNFIINFNRNKNLISNFLFLKRPKIINNSSHSSISSYSNNRNNKINLNINENKKNKENNEKKNYNTNINCKNNNTNSKENQISRNKLFIKEALGVYMKNNIHKNKTVITPDKDIKSLLKETQNNNLSINNTTNMSNINIINNTNPINSINEINLKKNSKKKISFLNKNKIINNIKTINSSFKKLNSFPSKFHSKEEISYLYLNSLNTKYISNTINLNSSLNSLNNNNGTKYYFNISKMYRKQMIEYMKHRINWKHIDYSALNSNDKNNININFEWKYYSSRINYKKYKYSPNMSNKKLKMINLFERNYEIGNKKNMFINLISYCDKINYNIFEIVPFTMILSNSKDIDIATNSLKEIIDFLESNKNTENNIITNRLYKDHFWFDKNFDTIKNQIIYFNKNFISDKNYWIIKPTDMYQGKYIEISNTFDDIYKKCLNMFKGVNYNLNKEIQEIEEENQKNEKNMNNNSMKKKNDNKKFSFSKMYCCSDIIIQKYLDNPLLYKKRKFDIRCFALLDNNLNLFYCKEGHLKGSSELYNVKKSNKFIHITNYSFQKKSSNFELYEDGNEISYKSFKLFLEQEGFPPDKFNKMIEDMKFLIKISFKSVSKKIYKTEDVLCFELFGYDFIIDTEFKPWILEINNNPGLGISSPVIKNIIPRMMDDAFRLTIDKIFETKYDEQSFDEEGKYKTRYHLDGYADDENIFEFLCNINH